MRESDRGCLLTLRVFARTVGIVKTVYQFVDIAYIVSTRQTSSRSDNRAGCGYNPVEMTGDWQIQSGSYERG